MAVIFMRKIGIILILHLYGFFFLRFHFVAGSEYGFQGVNTFCCIFFVHMILESKMFHVL